MNPQLGNDDPMITLLIFKVSYLEIESAAGDVSKPYLRPVRNFNRTDGHISESIITTNLKFGTLIDT